MNATERLVALLNESGDRDNPDPEQLKEIMDSVRSILTSR